MTYRYYSPTRPLYQGVTYPKWGSKGIKVVNFGEKKMVEDFPCHVWGYVEYQKPLNDRDLRDYPLFEPQEKK